VTDSTLTAGSPPATPEYLEKTYSWAYVTPEAVRRFERQWLVNLILWGNFNRLRDLALEHFGNALGGTSLQVACVYGDLTSRWEARHTASGQLEVIDVLPVQIENLKQKLGPDTRVHIRHANATSLPQADASMDRTLLFFLLHEMPLEVRLATVREAFRVTKPGGTLVFVDYHRPSLLHPLYLPMMGILSTLEPFALDLWQTEIAEWFPADMMPAKVTKQTYFGGLYQLIEVTR
jgi:ubiquinone/menaquinone biosynthesis C-methylase UbiE